MKYNVRITDPHLYTAILEIGNISKATRELLKQRIEHINEEIIMKKKMHSILEKRIIEKYGREILEDFKCTLVD